MQEYIYYSRAVITAQKNADEEFAAKFLREELELRGAAATDKAESGNSILVELKRNEALAGEVFSAEAEAGKIIVEAGGKAGFLYGVSYFLRTLYIKGQKIGVPVSFTRVTITPSNTMRGHQLGYRDKQNTCPAWTEVEYERYIRDLLIFGSNSIELLPPRTDDNLYSSHFRRDPMKLMVRLSEIIHSYGMQVHVWYPYLSLSIDKDIFEEEMREREEVFSKVPYIDGLLIPAGDPGDLPPEEMIRASEMTAKILHRYHPQAKVWLAPQSFAPEEDWYDRFYKEINHKPEWLYGVCFGPWEKDSIREMYDKLPECYKGTIRNYPDITHNISSQFEIPDWDDAFAYTLGRESYNPRPVAMKAIHDYHKGFVIGSITYSEGIHDDVNKMLWGSLDYDDSCDTAEVVRQYVRAFIDPDLEDELSTAICTLEDNWKQEITGNKSIEELYAAMLRIDSTASKALKDNYRYQMLLLRVIADYQTKIRYIHDQQLEKNCYAILRDSKTDVNVRISQALAELQKTYTEPVGVKERFMIQELADRLYRSCRIQLTTTRHKGQWLDRGAWVDTLDMALNDSQWITCELKRLKELKTNKDKEQAIIRLTERCNPGEGGVYVELGSREGFKRVVNNVSWEEDPCFLHSPLLAHNSHMAAVMYRNIGWYDEVPISVKWLHGARTLYGTPLEVRIEGLEEHSAYELSVTYQSIIGSDGIKARVYAGETMLCSEIKRSSDELCPVYTYELPEGYIADGVLKLKWQVYDVLRPVTVCELWIRRK